MFDGVGRRRDRRTGHFLNIGQHSLNGYERNCLFRANRDGTFTDVGWVNAADRLEDGRGLAVLDYDRNGTPDLLLRNYRTPAVLLRNRGTPGHHTLALRLEGRSPNTGAIGARVRIRTGAHWQTRVVAAGSGYLSGHSLVQHVGLGRAQHADEVLVTWPSGTGSGATGLAGDRLHVLREPAGR